jgi:peroxiredoxin Q/BCP
MILTIVTVMAALQACAEPPAIGAVAPDFTLPAQDARPISLKDYRQKWVVLYFSPSNFNENGTLEAEGFQQDAAKYVQANAVILSVSVDTPRSHEAFAEKEKLTFPLLSDPEAKVCRAYGSSMFFHMKTLAARNTFIIDPSGHIAQVFTQVVDPRHHSSDVLRALAALQHR